MTRSYGLIDGELLVGETVLFFLREVLVRVGLPASAAGTSHSNIEYRNYSHGEW